MGQRERFVIFLVGALLGVMVLLGVLGTGLQQGAKLVLANDPGEGPEEGKGKGKGKGGGEGKY